MSDEIETRPDRLALLWMDAAVVKPGDTLLVRYSTTKPVSARIAQEIKDFLKAKLPDVIVVVVQADEFVIYRPEDQA